MKGFLLCFFFLPFFSLKAQTPQEKESIARPLKTVEGLYSYRPTFFVLGDPDAKFQLSLKWKILEQERLFFGYTQLALWDIFEESSPFTDIKFTPEIFYRFKINFLNYSALDIGPYEHNSNGKDGLNSRSYDRSYLRFTSKKNFDDGFSFILENTFSLIYSKDKFNRDIERYLGFYEFNLRLRDFLPFLFEQEELYFKYVPGRDLFTLSDRDYGYLNLGFSFRLSDSFILPSFLIDYFSGHTETILNYRKKSTAFRFGIIRNLKF